MGLAGRRAPLPIYGLEATLKMAADLCAAMDLDWSYVARADWRPITAGSQLALEEGWVLHTAMTSHSQPCLALRFAASDGRAIGYSADTEPCEAVEKLVHGAHILIHEATTPGPFAGHTSPQQAGEVAVRAKVGRLVLVHYSPRWTMPEPEALAAVRAGGFGGLAEIGREYQVLAL